MKRTRQKPYTANQHNFTDNDIWGTVTYSPEKLPPSVESAQKEMAKYFRRLKYYAERHNFPPLKYVYVTEFDDDEEKGKKRVHHHFVTNFPDRDVAERLWRNGARTQTRRLQADENGYEGMARYISKDRAAQSVTLRQRTWTNRKSPSPIANSPATRSTALSVKNSTAAQRSRKCTAGTKC